MSSSFSHAGYAGSSPPPFETVKARARFIGNPLVFIIGDEDAAAPCAGCGGYIIFMV
jgi:hypothetical protein